MKIIINTPSIRESRGGVANHFKGLKDFWNEDVSYNIIGDRNGIPGFMIFPFDLIKFYIKCSFKRPDVIVLNPSLGKTALQRDAVFLKVARFFKIDVMVIFHGWNKDLEKSISNNPKWFLKNYGKATAFFVLANEFKVKMQEWGIKNPILLTTTKVDDNLVSNFNIKDKKYDYNILFLARVEKAKGIFIVLKAFKNILKKYPDSKLTIAGDGSSLQDAEDFVKENLISNITFTGKISGNTLKSVFKNNSIYILPTTHGEGMPTSILEAMAFGLAIITRPVGGVNDFFNKKMGVLINELDTKPYENVIIDLLNSPKKLNDMGHYNYSFAKDHFLASRVASLLEEKFKMNIIK